MAALLDINDDHPLALELHSLRTALARFQNEAHSASIKLQHNALNAAHAHERIRHLEHENARLREEAAVLRGHPHPAGPPQDPAALQTTISQLTIALRRVSDKLDLAESALLARTTELARAVGDRGQAQHEAEGAYALAARTRGREVEGLVRERGLQGRARAAEEEAKMADLVVMEYADLVRALEGRPNAHVHPHPQEDPCARSGPASPGGALPASNSATTLVDSLTEGKSGLQKLLSEFNTESTHLQAEIDRLAHELAVSLAKNDAQRRSAERDRDELAKAKFELEKLRMDDNTAAKMVSRYMKFSQQTANDLQASLSALTARHAATLSTLSFTTQTLQASLSREKRISEHLRAALDELSADIAREVYGRRREVALRLRLVGRDERLGEGVRRLARRMEDALRRMGDGEGGASISQVFEKLVAEAKGILDTLDGGPDETASRALGRIVAAESAVKMLTQELQVETEKRMRLERIVAVTAGERSEEQGMGDEDGRAVTTMDARSPSLAADNDLLTPVVKAPEGDVAVNGGASTSKGDGDVAGRPLSPVADTPTCIDSSAETTASLCPVDSDFGPVNSDSASTDIYSSVEVAPEPTAVGDPCPNQSPAPDRPVGPSASVPHVYVTASPGDNDQPKPQDDAKAGDPPITLPSSSCSDGNQTPDVSHRSMPNLTVTIDTLIDSSPHTDLDSRPNDSLDLAPLSSNHSLLAELTHVYHRYDALQRAFRDCHVALEDLKVHLKSSTSDAFMSPATSTMAIAAPLLQIALERLDDYTEDARVELEIRMADEALLARGFETLLSVPGALTSAVDPSFATIPSTDDQRRPERAEVERDIRAFVDGTDSSVARAVQSLTKKLDDIEHDITAVKRALYDPAADGGAPTYDEPPTPSAPPLSGSAKWTSWTAGILGGSSRPPSPAPTFGSVMTSPRLRHTPSLNFYGHSNHGRKMSVDLGTGGHEDPFASLGLRVPMPAYVQASPVPVRPGVQRRTLSAMYMLGLGAGGAGGPLLGAAAGLVGNGREEGVEGDGAERGDEADSGVE